MLHLPELHEVKAAPGPASPRARSLLSAAAGVCARSWGCGGLFVGPAECGAAGLGGVRGEG